MYRRTYYGRSFFSDLQSENIELNGRVTKLEEPVQVRERRQTRTNNFGFAGGANGPQYGASKLIPHNCSSSSSTMTHTIDNVTHTAKTI